MLKEYTKELARKGLVEEELTGSFITTEKGRMFLKFYNQIKELLTENESSFQGVDSSTRIIPGRSKLLSLGVNKRFLQQIKISDEQERDLIKGILYLRDRVKDISNGN